MPVGMEIMGTCREEERLLGIALGVERVFTQKA